MAKQPCGIVSVLTFGGTLAFAPHPANVGGLAVMAGFIVWRHRANIGRLRSGTESRIGDKLSPSG